MILSKGFIYRHGVRIKDFGERLGMIKIFDVFIFGDLASRIIKKGLAIKNSVSRYPINDM